MHELLRIANDLGPTVSVPCWGHQLARAARAGECIRFVARRDATRRRRDWAQARPPVPLVCDRGLDTIGARAARRL